MHSDFKQEFKRQFEIYKPLVLVADDDLDNLLLASYVIESLGMNYVVTDDGKECLRLVRQLLPDIILLDIVMPVLNGLEIINDLKEDYSVAHIPIVAVTGLTRLEDKQKIAEAGCDDYLRKPYLIEELELKICSCFKCHLIQIQK